MACKYCRKIKNKVMTILFKKIKKFQMSGKSDEILGSPLTANTTSFGMTYSKLGDIIAGTKIKNSDEAQEAAKFLDINPYKKEYLMSASYDMRDDKIKPTPLGLNAGNEYRILVTSNQPYSFGSTRKSETYPAGTHEYNYTPKQYEQFMLQGTPGKNNYIRTLILTKRPQKGKI